jgi:hypothetical protein
MGRYLTGQSRPGGINFSTVYASSTLPVGTMAANAPSDTKFIPYFEIY